jgi:menaquinone-dependent protoporphyrinogen oxidase
MSPKPVSRRDFLKVAGVTLGAATFACSGLAMLGTRQPAVAYAEETIGESKMTNKILVTYASRAGSTAGVAETIGKTLAAGGAQVDVRRMDHVEDLGRYVAVVAGSAIRGGKWLPEAMEFVQRHRTDLVRKPFATFLVCITLAMPKAAEYGQFVSDFMKPVRALAKPVSVGTFAGALEYSKVPLVPEGMQLRILSATSQTPPGDYRDWDAIRRWAKQLGPMLETA